MEFIPYVSNIDYIIIINQQAKHGHYIIQLTTKTTLYCDEHIFQLCVFFSVTCMK